MRFSPVVISTLFILVTNIIVELRTLCIKKMHFAVVKQFAAETSEGIETRACPQQQFHSHDSNCLAEIELHPSACRK